MSIRARALYSGTQIFLLLLFDRRLGHVRRASRARIDILDAASIWRVINSTSPTSRQTWHPRTRVRLRVRLPDRKLTADIVAKSLRKAEAASRAMREGTPSRLCCKVALSRATHR